MNRQDKAFRKTLVESVPGADPVLKVLFQEEGNAVEEASKSINRATRKASDVKETFSVSVSQFLGNSSEKEKSTPSKCKYCFDTGRFCS